MKRILVFFSLLMLAIPAHATKYRYQYTFASGELVEGIITSRESGDYLTRIYGASITFGTEDPHYEGGAYFGSSGIDRYPVVSFLAENNDFIFSGYDRIIGLGPSSPLPPSDTPNRYFSMIQSSGLATVVFDDLTTITETIDPSRWSLRMSRVPETATTAGLLAGAATLLAAARRRLAFPK